MSPSQMVLLFSSFHIILPYLICLDGAEDVKRFPGWMDGSCSDAVLLPAFLLLVRTDPGTAGSSGSSSSGLNCNRSGSDALIMKECGRPPEAIKSPNWRSLFHGGQDDPVQLHPGSGGAGRDPEDKEIHFLIKET